MKSLYYFILLGSLLLSSCGEKDSVFLPKYAPYQQVDPNWVDSILGTLSTNEKIGQLLLIETFDTSKQTLQKLLQKTEEKTISGWQTGFSDVERYDFWIDTLQQISRFPLFIQQRKSFDFHTYPDELLQAISDKKLLENWRQQHRFFQQELGINFDCATLFKPNTVVDTTLNINYLTKHRTDAKKRIIQKIRAVQKDTILASIQDYGTFTTLPNDTLGILDSLLAPYKTLVRAGLSSIEIADSIYTSTTFLQRPPNYVQDYLANQLQFNGLIVSNYIQKKLILPQFQSGTVLFNIPIKKHASVFKQFETLLEEEEITIEALDQKVRKILLAKYWLNSKTPNKFPIDTISTVKNSTEYAFLHQQMKEQSIVLVQHKKGQLPFKKIQKNNPFWLNFGKKLTGFKTQYERYDGVLNQQIETAKSFNPAKYKYYNPLIITLNSVELSNKDSLWLQGIQTLAKSNTVVFINLKNPNNLPYLKDFKTLIQTFDNSQITQDLLTQLLHGGIKANGKLPYTISNDFVYLQKADKTAITRLKYTMPEEIGIASQDLNKIDSIVQEAISQKAAPGCQVLAIKDGKIFFNKVYGHHTYSRKRKVAKEHLYDVASITKVTATTLSAMKLQENQQLVLKKPLKHYLKNLDTVSIRDITLKNLFIHQSGLQANMPIRRFLKYQDTARYGNYSYFEKKKTSPYSIPVAKNFHLRKDWHDTLWTIIKSLPLEYNGVYKYSDINMNIAQKVLENIVDSNLQKYTKATFYDPLNLFHTTYNPLDIFKKTQIVPSERDRSWRKQLVHGYVHDESAALLGGVGGNAGLFSTTQDLAIIYQMLLNGGTYGDERFFKSKTINFFTSAIHGNHRGLGFNKPKSTGHTPACSSSASAATYGHTGFTGCCVWVDPNNGLIYIFLSNRVYPQRNNRLSRLRTRKRIHEVFYQALQ